MKLEPEKIVAIAKKAGKAIMEVYPSDFSVEEKESETFEEGTSPLTEADLKSNEIIVDGLKELYPQVPVLSEETKEIPYEKRSGWASFFLVDPLDGTKEFIKRNGEFTVNIAFIFQEEPIFGVVYYPVKDVTYYTKDGKAFIETGGLVEELPLKTSKKAFTAVASKSHFSDETRDYIHNLKKVHQDLELINAGSSLKLCKVAEGSADIYPRLGPTMEWDTAAAHAIVKAAGKNVYAYDPEKKAPAGEMTYNKENLLNPWFIVE